MARYALLIIALAAATALAQVDASDAGTSGLTLETSVAGVPVKVTPVGYVEAYYGFNFNLPSNGLTSFRGFDNRHNSLTLSNVALGAVAEAGPVGARLVLQVGSTPSTYYLSEPTVGGAAGASGSSPDVWKYVQEAHVTYQAPLGRGLLLQLGLCASPIGFEVVPVKDNWNWSRSNLFFGFPFYHAGLRATYEWTDRLSTTVSLFNGWNAVVDNNRGKSVQAALTYQVPDVLSLQLLYFGGPERPTGAAERDPWRHHFDFTAQWDAAGWLSLAVQADAGFEAGNLGTASWYAGAVYARLKPHARVAITLRGDAFHEGLGRREGRATTPLFWGGLELIASGTATLELKPHHHLAVRLEYRHDFASGNLFFRGTVTGDGSADQPFVPNASSQDTLVLGATAWL